MIVCIDSNVLVQALSATRPYHCILAALAMGRMKWAISTSIYLEYRELITTFSGVGAWQRVAKLLELIESSGDLVHVFLAFQFRIISADPDDNAFTTAPSLPMRIM